MNDQILETLENICRDVCKKKRIKWDAFGGDIDHIHLLLDAHLNVPIRTFINNLKTVTRRIITKKFENHLKKFYYKPVF